MAKKTQPGVQDGKNGQVAIVTGASSGIGLGITRALLERGYRVVANSRTISKSKDLKPSADLVLADGDIGKKDVAVEVAETLAQKFCRLYFLLKKTGIYIPKQITYFNPQGF